MVPTIKPSSAAMTGAVDEMALVAGQHHQHRIQVLRLAHALARQHGDELLAAARSASGGG
jgi:hypothetical protein